MWEIIEHVQWDENKYEAPVEYNSRYFSNAFKEFEKEVNSVLDEQDKEIILLKKKIIKMSQIYKMVEQTNILLSSIIDRQALSKAVKWWETDLLLNEVRNWMAKILEQRQEDIG